MNEVFPPRQLPPSLINQLNDFLKRIDFSELYKSYDWENDNHPDGFPEILSLEVQLGRSARNEGIVFDDIYAVAEWGNHTTRNKIRCFKSPALSAGELYSLNGNPLNALRNTPTSPIKMLDRNTTYLGPTYLSKVLRFAMPEQYGAIDTWCVRVFGEGDIRNGRHKWLSLRVINPDTRPSIPKQQKGWPIEYGKWINILRYFTHKLPANCPHPSAFVEKGLREKGKWTCADVEMALFAYSKDHESCENPSSRLLSYDDLL